MMRMGLPHRSQRKMRLAKRPPRARRAAQGVIEGEAKAELEGQAQQPLGHDLPRPGHDLPRPLRSARVKLAAEMRPAIVVTMLVILAGCGRLGYDRIGPQGGDVTCDAAGDGIVAWYRLDGLEGDGIADSSGNGLDGVCADPCPNVVAGVIEQALAFDAAVPHRIDLPASPLLELDRGFTLAMWARVPPDPADGASTITKRLGDGSDNSFQLAFQVSGDLWFNTDGPAGRDTLQADSVLTDDVWHHIAGTWSVDGDKRLVVDGALAAARPSEGVSFDGSVTRLGADHDDAGFDNYMAGNLDDVRIYDRPLTLEELATLAACGP